MGFRSLQHMWDRRSTCRGPCRGPLRSARRVWLPSRRLTPSEPVPALFRAGSALGIRPSELSPLGRYPPSFRAEEPTRRFSRRFLPPRTRWAGPTGRGLWAFTLPGVPCDRRRFSTAITGCSLGLRPLRACGQNLARDIARTPPTRLSALRFAAENAASRSIYQFRPRLLRCRRTG